MGAATALLHADRDPSIGAICADSPFASLRQLAEELAQSDRVLFPVPSWLVEAALALIRMRVQTLAGFDIEDLVPLDHARRSNVPVIFVHAKQDSFIHPGHSQQLYDAYYEGNKELITVDGDHNSERGEQVVSHVIAFFKRSLRLETVDMSVPSHILDLEFAVPQRDGLPLRVPAHKQGLNVPPQSGEDKENGGRNLPPPVAARPPPSKSKPFLQGSNAGAEKVAKYGPGGAPPRGDLDSGEDVDFTRILPSKKVFATAAPFRRMRVGANGGA